MIKRMEEPEFNAPIPGMSLTNELGSRPWEKPPQFATVEETAEHYSMKMQNEEFVSKLGDVLEDGIPVTLITNSIMLAGVMDGIHTIDVGVLVAPVIMENIMLIGDALGVEYVTGLDDEPTAEPDQLDFMRALQEGGEVEMDDMEDEVEDMPTEATKTGLMARPMRSE